MADIITYKLKLRTDRRRVFKLGGGIDHVTSHVWTLSKVKRSKVKVTRSRNVSAPTTLSLGDGYSRINFLKLGGNDRAEPAQVDLFWRSIRHTTCFRPRMCHLGVSFVLLPILGVQSPKTPIFEAWIGIFKLNVQNIKICILSKFLHRLPPNFAQSQRPPSTPVSYTHLRAHGPY